MLGYAQRLLFAGVCVSALIGPVLVHAESIEGALSRAYTSNPDLNAQRAALRALDEGVARAAAGGRPKLNAIGEDGIAELWSKDAPKNGNHSQSHPRGVSAVLTQTLFSSGKVEATIAAAERGVFAARSTLANVEQKTLVDAATSYMDVMRDTSVLELRRNNLGVLREQLRQTQDRFSVGEVTRTDVAQVEARLAAAQADMATAEGTLKTSIAKYRQIIGDEPRQMSPARPLAKVTYKSLNEALTVAISSHPSIIASSINIEVAEYQLRQAYAGLGPTLSVNATSSLKDDVTYVPNRKQNLNAIAGTLTFPIYDGGESYASIRQSKEVIGQRRLELDSTREKVRADVVSAWSQLEAAKARIQSANAQVEAATIALNGIREEAKVGQRTTLDVLLTDQDLLSARVSLVTAQRDRVVSSYTLAQSAGQLNIDNLKLNVKQYNPATHYENVSGKWFGISIMDGE
jgi:outer membrane protein